MWLLPIARRLAKLYTKSINICLIFRGDGLASINFTSAIFSIFHMNVEGTLAMMHSKMQSPLQATISNHEIFLVGILLCHLSQLQTQSVEKQLKL